MNDLIEEAILVLQRLLTALKGKVPAGNGNAIETVGSVAYSNTESDANNTENSGKVPSPQDKKLTLILKFPNCDSCDGEKKEENNNWGNIEDFREIDVDPAFVQQLSPSDPIEKIISGLVSPQSGISSVLEGKLDTFQGQLDHFSGDISSKLETLSNRIGSLESVKSPKSKHK